MPKSVLTGVCETNTMYSFEEKLFREGYSVIAGVDEAGRGPLAGPVVAAAVILPRGEKIEGINDSKKLTPRKRALLFEEIKHRALFGIGIVGEYWIDKLNILQATRLAMREAVLNLPRLPEYVLIDGNVPIDIPFKKLNIVGGDSLSASVAAGSIVAKVTRDRLMYVYDLAFPRYEFRVHKGYPTANHVRILSDLGPSPIHRLSFRPVRRVLERSRNA
ncbi:MAG: ribonuclease HII [Candidatus Omnitrophica bacterium]|nr:ribonuclease HII [Candidatus Omnitrophota bacterium]